MAVAVVGGSGVRGLGVGIGGGFVCGRERGGGESRLRGGEDAAEEALQRLLVTSNFESCTPFEGKPRSVEVWAGFPSTRVMGRTEKQA